MKEKEVVSLMLSKENEISCKVHNAVNEVLRVGADTPRGKAVVSDLIASIQYTVDDFAQLHNRIVR